MADEKPLLTEPGNPKTRLWGAPLIDRLMYRTWAGPGDCWTWQGSLNTKGYGHIRGDLDAPLVSVHVASYRHFIGPVPEGLEIDHLCFNRACVNPAHLEAVTHEENVRRGRTNQNHGKTHCKRGHEFTEANTLFDKRGRRACKTCATERMREWRARKGA